MEAPSRRGKGSPSMYTGRTAECARRASAAWWSFFLIVGRTNTTREVARQLEATAFPR